MQRDHRSISLIKKITDIIFATKLAKEHYSQVSTTQICLDSQHFDVRNP